MNRVKLILICFSLILVGCSEDEDDPVSAPTDAEILASFPGTYTMSGLADYPGGDCSVAADAVTGECAGYGDITIEADCPVGMCFGDPELSETDCPEDSWFTGYCDGGDAEFYTQESCEAAGEEWGHFGWMNYSDYMAEDGMTFTFLADGTFSESDFICEDNDYNEIDAIDEAACEAAGGEVHAEQGTWTLSGSTLTLIEEPWCEDSDGLADIDPTDEAACLVANGEWVDDEVLCSGETSGDSFTCSMANDAECHTSGPEDGAEPANQADCEDADGYWDDANCMEFTFTKI